MKFSIFSISTHCTDGWGKGGTTENSFGEVIHSVIYSTSELTKIQVLQSFWNNVMSLRVIQKSDEKSVTEEYGFKKEVLSNGPNSGTLSRDI